MTKTLPLLPACLALAALPLAGCDLDELLDRQSDEPPAIEDDPEPETDDGNDAPPGQVMVTVVANSTPQGATVTGGGQLLGTTPFQREVPVPAPQPGEVQTFAFSFELAGYQPQTINAQPVNQTISLAVGLIPNTPPPTPPVPVPSPDEDDDPSGSDGSDPSSGGPRVLNVTGRGGGRITDFQTTRGSATVREDCTIGRLRVRLRGRHTYYRDLIVRLRGPGGQNYMLYDRVSNSQSPFRGYTVRRARGRSARGRWTLSIEDTLRADSGRLSGWSMEIRCR